MKPPPGKRKLPRELTPLQLRRRAMALVSKAIKHGELPKLDGTIACVDCGEPATAYEHRNYYHPLSVDPVCTGCNIRRGPGFPLNPDGDEYTSLFGPKSFGWDSKLGPTNRPTEHHSNRPEKSVANFIDEHWIQWEPDPDVRKIYQEMQRIRGRPYGYTSFQRGLYDWFGVEPL